jgi:Carboxypeptidase regulatory-like domain
MQTVRKTSSDGRRNPSRDWDVALEDSSWQRGWSRGKWASRSLGVLGMLAAMLMCLPVLHAQTTAELSGTVTDPSGSVIPNAQVKLINEATGDARVVETNAAGLYSFPALLPSSYTLKVTAKGFEQKQLTGVVLHAGDHRDVSAFQLAVGASTETVTVSASGQMIPEDNGERTAVLDSKDIENLALQGRDTTELLKVLPGATTTSGGLTQNNPSFSDLNVSANESSIGTGINLTRR